MQYLKGTVLFAAVIAWIGSIALPPPWHLIFLAVPAGLFVLFIWLACCSVFRP